jgi:hypothetical protein
MGRTKIDVSLINIVTSILNMGSNKITNLANGTVSTDAVNLSQLTANGTVNSGTQYQLGYYATTGTTISGDSAITTDSSNALNVTNASPFDTLNLTGTESTGAGVNISMASTGGANITGNILLDARVGQQQSIKISTTGISGVIIQGTATNDTAPAGRIGEVISGSRLRSNGLSLTTGTSATITSITLTPGDWEVFWAIGVRTGGATTLTTLVGAVSLTNNAVPSGDTQCVQDSSGQVSLSNQWAGNPMSPGAANDLNIGGMPSRVSISTSTTYFLIINSSFAASTLIGYGSLQARRMR